jgi:hypothetical protein
MSANNIVVYISIICIIFALLSVVCCTCINITEGFGETTITAQPMVSTIQPTTMQTSLSTSPTAPTANAVTIQPVVEAPVAFTWYTKYGQGMTGEKKYDVIDAYSEADLIYACEQVGAFPADKKKLFEKLGSAMFDTMKKINDQAKLLKLRDDDIWNEIVKEIKQKQIDTKKSTINSRISEIRGKMRQNAMNNAKDTIEKVKDETRNTIRDKFRKEKMINNDKYFNFAIPRRRNYLRDICSNVDMTVLDTSTRDGMLGVAVIYKTLQDPETAQKLSKLTSGEIEEAKRLVDDLLFKQEREDAERVVAQIAESTKEELEKEMVDYVNNEIVKARLEAQEQEVSSLIEEKTKAQIALQEQVRAKEVALQAATAQKEETQQKVLELKEAVILQQAQKQELQKTINEEKIKNDAKITSKLAKFFRFGGKN